MPSSLVICALDPFGAEVLARVLDLDSSYREDKRIVWTWLGEGPSPPGPVDWSEQPADKEALELRPDDWPAVSVNFNRKESLGIARVQATRILEERNRSLQRTAGAEEDQMVWLLFVGSLANPDSAVLAQACFEALVEKPALWQSWRMAGVWALARSTCDHQLDDETCDAATAVSLDDFQRVLERAKNKEQEVWHPLFPQYLIGAGPSLVEPPPSRPDSALQGAMAVLGVVERKLRSTDKSSIFHFDHETDHTARWCGRNEFDASRPFGILGAAMISQRPAVLRECAAGVLLREMLMDLQKQAEPQDGLGPLPQSTDAKDLEAYVNPIVSETLAGLVSCLEKNGFKLPSGLKGEFSPEIVVEMLGWDKRIQTWKERINDVFGWPSLKILPLEDWDQTLQELEAVALRFFKADKERTEQIFITAVLESTRTVIATGLRRICQDTTMRQGTPAFWQPHLVCRFFLKRLQERIEEDVRRLDLDLINERRNLPDDREMAQFEPNRRILAGRLRRMIRMLPSPFAMACRIVPLALVCWLIFQWIDFSYYEGKSESFVFHAKWIKGAASSLLLGGYLWVRARVIHYRIVRQTYQNWHRLMLEQFEAELRKSLVTIRERSHHVCRDYLRFLADPKLASSMRFRERTQVPLPPANTEFFARAEATAHVSDCKVRRFLHRYHRDLLHGIRAWEVWIFQQIPRFNQAHRDLVLPRIPPGRQGVDKLRILVREAFPKLTGESQERHELFRSLSSDAQNALRRAPDREAWLLLQHGRAGRIGETEWLWEGDFSQLPFPSRKHREIRDHCRRVLHAMAGGLAFGCPHLHRTLGTWILNDLYLKTNWDEVGNLHIKAREDFVQLSLQQHPLYGAAGEHPYDAREIWVPEATRFSDSFQTDFPDTVYHDIDTDSEPYAGFLVMCRLRLNLDAAAVVNASPDPSRSGSILGLQRSRAMERHSGSIPPLLIPAIQ